jgi:putative nucleotidyltransferase with HDIG domain
MSALPWWGRVYITSVAALGGGILVHSLFQIIDQPIGRNWFILAFLTLVTGSATVKLPSVPATISISETFVITSTLLYGPAAGTLTVALDAIVISIVLALRGHPPYRVIFNICALPASLWAAAHLFFWSAKLPPIASLPPDEKVAVGLLLVPLIIFTASYFALNSGLIALAISIEKALSPVKVWRENFAWLSLNYFGGASVAALLVAYGRALDYGFIAIILPILAVLFYTFKSAMGRVEDTNKHLRELNKLYMSTIETLAMAIDAKDQVTHGHIRRVQQYAVALARKVGINDGEQISAIEAASLLHDMGKLAVPEYILNKPGALTPAEFEKMKLHASVGADILSAINFPYPVVPIVRHHHENWDGSGYPDGLKGTDIPLGARILSVVDCFDALTSDRPYRPKLPDSEAVRILLDRRGKMYDPVVVDTFIEIHGELTATIDVEKSDDGLGLSAITRGIVNAYEQPSKSQARLEQINASSEETLAMYELARSLSGPLSVQQVGETIAKHLRRIVPATFVLYSFDEQSDELVAAYAAGEHSALFADLRIPRGQRLTGWVAANHQTVLNSDPVLDLGDAARLVKPPLKAYAGTTVTKAGRLVGVIGLYSSQRQIFGDDHGRILEAVSKQAASCLDQPDGLSAKPKVDRSASASVLPDADEMEALIGAEISRETTLAILVVDLRPALPRLGHIPEDTVRALAEIVRASVRKNDIVGRYSRLSLVVMMPGADRGAASDVATRVAVAMSGFTSESGASLTTTMGIAVSSPMKASVRALVDLARQGSTASSRPSVH